MNQLVPLPPNGTSLYKSEIQPLLEKIYSGGEFVASRGAELVKEYVRPVDVYDAASMFAPYPYRPALSFGRRFFFNRSPGQFVPPVRFQRRPFVYRRRPLYRWQDLYRHPMTGPRRSKSRPWQRRLPHKFLRPRNASSFRVWTPSSSRNF